jgi:excisionase family DNA binding protein
MDEDRLIGAAEAAELLHVDRSTLVRWVRRGKIAAADKWEGTTGPYRFRYAAIARLADERKERV